MIKGRVLLLFSLSMLLCGVALGQKVSAQVNFEYEGRNCFLDSNGLTNCFYPDSSLYSKGGLVLSRKGILTRKTLVKVGQWIYYHPSGPVESFGVFKDGEKKGVWTFLSNQGNVVSQEFYE